MFNMKGFSKHSFAFVSVSAIFLLIVSCGNTKTVPSSGTSAKEIKLNSSEKKAEQTKSFTEVKENKSENPQENSSQIVKIESTNETRIIKENAASEEKIKEEVPQKTEISKAEPEKTQSAAEEAQAEAEEVQIKAEEIPAESAEEIQAEPKEISDGTAGQTTENPIEKIGEEKKEIAENQPVIEEESVDIEQIFEKQIDVLIGEEEKKADEILLTQEEANTLIEETNVLIAEETGTKMPEKEDDDEYIRSIGSAQISKNTFEHDKAEIINIIENLASIMKNLDYDAWLKYIDKNSVEYWQKNSNLKKAQAKLPVAGVKLNNLEDYFKYVFVPARAGREVTDIRYESDSYVKVVQVIAPADSSRNSKEKNIVYYNFNKINGHWKLYLPKINE